jgi:hypothetical protein
VAIKNTQQGVFYYQDSVALEALFLEGGRMEAAAFVSSWKALPDASEATKQLPLNIGDLKAVQVRGRPGPLCCSAHPRVLGTGDACGVHVALAALGGTS